MKRTSALNPYAASYVPLSKKVAASESEHYKLTGKDSKSAKEYCFFESQPENAQAYKSIGADTIHTTENCALKGCSFGMSSGSSSKNQNEMEFPEDDFDLALAYLQTVFPGISDESLCEVYIANKYDLAETVEMLNQLQVYSCDELPDTLDIGDVRESESSQKLKKTSAEEKVGVTSYGGVDCSGLP